MILAKFPSQGLDIYAATWMALKHIALNEREKKLYKHSSICAHKTTHFAAKHTNEKIHIKDTRTVPGKRREELQQEKNMEIKGLNKQTGEKPYTDP